MAARVARAPDAGGRMTAFPYVYRWNRPDVGPRSRKGQPCAVTARGKMNSIRVEFADGFKMITSRYAVRKARVAG